jgi:nucleotide-binding universal stress UspA family protein
MPRIYLVGYDGSDAASDAVRLTTRLAESAVAQVVAVNAYPVPQHVVGKGAADEPERELAEESRALALQALEGLERHPLVETVALPGSPAAALIGRAEEGDVELLAVGATHRRAIGRLLVGSVGEQLLHGAPCPVLVVPQGTGDRPIESVAVAFDGGPEATAALAEGRALAARHHAQLVMLAVAERRFGTNHLRVGTSEAARAHQRLHDDLADVAKEAGAELRIVSHARPGAALVEACETGVDIVIAGSRGFGPRKAVLLGSVSRHLVDHAACPVLVVPRAAAIVRDTSAAGAAKALA